MTQLRWRYREWYKCGCTSEWTTARRNLRGYCSSHGADRDGIESEPVEAKRKASIKSVRKP